jgi:hypothetical protein
MIVAQLILGGFPGVVAPTLVCIKFAGISVLEVHVHRK